MSDEAAFEAGAGLTSMMLHQVVFTTLIKRGLLTPNQVRELLDGIALKLEEMTPTPALAAAQEQARRLLAVLEATCVEMIGSRLLRES